MMAMGQVALLDGCGCCYGGLPRFGGSCGPGAVPMIVLPPVEFFECSSVLMPRYLAMGFPVYHMIEGSRNQDHSHRHRYEYFLKYHPEEQWRVIGSGSTARFWVVTDCTYPQWGMSYMKRIQYSNYPIETEHVPGLFCGRSLLDPDMSMDLVSHDPGFGPYLREWWLLVQNFRFFGFCGPVSNQDWYGFAGRSPMLINVDYKTGHFNTTGEADGHVPASCGEMSALAGLPYDWNLRPLAPWNVLHAWDHDWDEARVIDGLTSEGTLKICPAEGPDPEMTVWNEIYDPYWRAVHPVLTSETWTVMHENNGDLFSLDIENPRAPGFGYVGVFTNYWV